MTLAMFARSVLWRPTSLRQRTLNATIWSVTELAANNVVRLASNLILTRILLPEAFGAAAIVTTIQVGLVLVTDISIHRSIVQSTSGEDPRFLRVSWVVQAVRGLMLTGCVLLASLLLWLLAPGFAGPGTIYADPNLPGLVALSSLSMLASGLESTNLWVAVRKMQLGRITILNILTQVVSTLFILLFARLSPTAWAFVWGGVITSVIRLLLTHRIFEGPQMGSTGTTKSQMSFGS